VEPRCGSQGPERGGDGHCPRRPQSRGQTPRAPRAPPNYSGDGTTNEANLLDFDLASSNYRTWLWLGKKLSPDYHFKENRGKVFRMFSEAKYPRKKASDDDVKRTMGVARVSSLSSIGLVNVGERTFCLDQCAGAVTERGAVCCKLAVCDGKTTWGGWARARFYRTRDKGEIVTLLSLGRV